MKTIPNAILSGLNNNYERGLLIKITGKDETMWFSSKIITFLSGDSELAVNYERLSLEIDEENAPPFQVMEHEIDLSLGGGYFPGQKFSVSLLNYDRFDIQLKEKEIDGRLVIVYLFFIPPGTNIIMLSDTMIIAHGKAENILIYDYRRIIINCIPFEFITHKIIPVDKITDSEYPYAPKTSLEKTIPAVYGSFGNTNLKINNYNVIPGICIDENSQEYVLSHHESNSYNINCYYPVSNLSVLSKIISGYSFINSSGKSSVVFSGKLKCEAYIQPKIKGSQLNSNYNLTFKNAVDKNEATLVQVLSNHNFYLGFSEFGSTGYPEAYNNDINIAYFELYFILGNVINGINGKAAKIKYYLDGNFVYFSGNDIYANMSNSEVSFLFYFPMNDLFKILSRMEIGLTIEENGSVEIKNMFIRLKYYPY
jgi:hypothetical protein